MKIFIILLLLINTYTYAQEQGVWSLDNDAYIINHQYWKYPSSNTNTEAQDKITKQVIIYRPMDYDKNLDVNIIDLSTFLSDEKDYLKDPYPTPYKPYMRSDFDGNGRVQTPHDYTFLAIAWGKYQPIYSATLRMLGSPAFTEPGDNFEVFLHAQSNHTASTQYRWEYYGFTYPKSRWESLTPVYNQIIPDKHIIGFAGSTPSSTLRASSYIKLKLPRGIWFVYFVETVNTNGVIEEIFSEPLAFRISNEIVNPL